MRSAAADPAAVDALAALVGQAERPRSSPARAPTARTLGGAARARRAARLPRCCRSRSAAGPASRRTIRCSPATCPPAARACARRSRRTTSCSWSAPARCASTRSTTGPLVRAGHARGGRHRRTPTRRTAARSSSPCSATRPRSAPRWRAAVDARGRADAPATAAPAPPPPPAAGEPLRAGHVLAALADAAAARRDPRRGDAVEPPGAARPRRRHRAARVRQRDGHARLRAARRDRPAHGAPGPPGARRGRRRLLAVPGPGAVERGPLRRRRAVRRARQRRLRDHGPARRAQRRRRPVAAIDGSTSARWRARSGCDAVARRAPRGAARARSTPCSALAAATRRSCSRSSSSPTRRSTPRRPPPRCSSPRAPRASAARRRPARPNRALVEHDHAVAQGRELVDVGRADEHGRARRGGRADQRVHLALAPTSTPRVGSSSRNTDGCASSHLANTSFCWLPPDSEPAGWSTERLRIRSPRTCSRARRAQRARAHDPARRPPGRPSGSARRSPTSACRASARAGGGRRSRARRRRGSRRRSPCGTCRPSGSSTGPRPGAAARSTSSSTAWWPAPATPASPTISPARTSSVSGSSAPSTAASRSSSRPVAGVDVDRLGDRLLQRRVRRRVSASRLPEHRVDDRRHGQLGARLRAQLDVRRRAAP